MRSRRGGRTLPCRGQGIVVRKEFEVRTGDFRFAQGGGLLLTRGVGSCVVACLWDATSRIGGMAHIPLGDSRLSTSEETGRPGLFADTALPCLLGLMLARGARRERVTVRLVGAGNMFEGRDEGFMGEVTQGILDGVDAAIESLGLIVRDRSLGGMHGRSVFFDVGTGRIEVRLTNGERVSL